MNFSHKTKSNDALLQNLSYQQKNNVLNALLLEKEIREDVTYKANELKNSFKALISKIQKNHIYLTKKIKPNSDLSELYFKKNGLNDNMSQFFLATQNNEFKAYNNQNKFFKILPNLDKAIELFEKQSNTDNKILSIISLFGFISSAIIIFSMMSLVYKALVKLISTNNTVILNQKKRSDFLLKIALIINKSKSLNDALKTILPLISQYIEWETAHAFTIDEKSQNLMISTKIWSPNTIKYYEELKNITEQITFSIYDFNLDTTKVTHSDWISLFIKNFATSRNDVLQKNEIKKLLVFPVINNNKIVLVLEFFTKKIDANEFTQDVNIFKQIETELIHIYSREIAENNIISLNKSLEKSLEKQKELEKISIKNAYFTGMSEIAINTLHNIGNILNSANISIELLVQDVYKSQTHMLEKVNNLLETHITKMEQFFAEDKKEILLIEYCIALHKKLIDEFSEKRNETFKLKEIITEAILAIKSQQDYTDKALPLDLFEIISLKDIVNEELKILQDLITNNNIVVKNIFVYEPVVEVNKSKLSHMLLNLIKNAIESMKHVKDIEKTLTIEINKTETGNPYLKISDVGIGIEKEKIDKIFAQGFTTRKNRNGLNLHSCYLTAKEFHGEIKVTSDGLNHGAQFTIVFPSKHEITKMNLSSDEKKHETQVDQLG